MFLGVFLSAPSEQLDFLISRGVPVVVTEKKEVMYAMVPQRCQHLTPAARCGIYDDRPNICKEFPARELDLTGLKEHCGYQFIEEKADATPPTRAPA